MKWGFSWGNAGLGDVPETALYTIQYKTTQGDQMSKPISDIEFVYTPNFLDQDTPSYHVDQGIGMIIDEETGVVFIGVYNNGQFSLHSSFDNGMEFNEVQFPDHQDVCTENGLYAPVIDLFFSDPEHSSIDLSLANIVLYDL